MRNQTRKRRDLLNAGRYLLHPWFPHLTQRRIAVAEGNREARPSPARPPRKRSIEAPGTDAGDVERLTRRLEAVSQHMADLLGCRNRRWSYAFLMKKGGQQVPMAETKGKGRTRGRVPTNEGTVMAPDVPPPSPPPERPPSAFARGETLEPSTARPKVRISRKSRAVQSSFIFC